MKKPISPAARALAVARNKIDLQSEGKSSINFEHRRPDMTKDYVRKEFAEFDLFNSLCVAQGVNHCVDNVYFDTSSLCFEIKLNDLIQFSRIEQIIKECATNSLSQFVIDGIVFHKIWGKYGKS